MPVGDDQSCFLYSVGQAIMTAARGRRRTGTPIEFLVSQPCTVPAISAGSRAFERLLGRLRMCLLRLQLGLGGEDPNANVLTAVFAQVTPPATDDGAATIVDSARQLEADVDRLWRLDTSILR